MNRMHITNEVWCDARFASLQEAMGWSRTHTLGLLVMFWHATRHKDAKQWLTEADVMQHLSGSKPERQAAMHGMLDCGYLFAQGEFYEVPDNAKYFEQVARLREAGRRGGAPRHRAYKARIAKEKAATSEPAGNTAITGLPLPVPELGDEPKAYSTEAGRVAWQVYSEAYRARYGVDPVPNGKNRKQIVNLIKRVGADNGPAVLKFYVEHNDRFYVQKQHDLSYATRDADGLLTQYKTGRAMTGNDAREHEAQDRVQSQLRRLGMGGL